MYKFETAQQIFDHIVTHLLTQNKKATKEVENAFMPQCSYRGDNGTKCAAGSLIDDEHYDPWLEGYNVLDGSVRQALVLSGVNTNEHVGLVHNLQCIHDNFDPVEWNFKLRKIALNNNLIVNFS